MASDCSALIGGLARLRSEHLGVQRRWFVQELPKMGDVVTTCEFTVNCVKVGRKDGARRVATWHMRPTVKSHLCLYAASSRRRGTRSNAEILWY